MGADNWQAQLVAMYSLDHWWGYVARLATITLIALLARYAFTRLVRRFFHYALRDDRLVVSERRARTLEGLLVSLATFTVVLVAFVWGLLLLGIADARILLPALGLFSAGFGLGARPLVSDYLAGITLLFEYTYAYGEKVEIMDVIGTVENVGLRTTRIRADSGELFVVPNGDVRVIRNFSRGSFSPASVRINIAAKDLAAAIAVLETLADDIVTRHGEELVGHPEVISETGELADKTQLTLLARAKFGHGAHLRRNLMTEVHQALEQAGIVELG